MARSRARAVRPAQVCATLLAALDVSDGRSRSRKRDQTPDRVGLGIKRALLERAVRDDPAPAAFEGWLLERCLAGATLARARCSLRRRAPVARLTYGRRGGGGGGTTVVPAGTHTQ